MSEVYWDYTARYVVLLPANGPTVFAIRQWAATRGATVRCEPDLPLFRNEIVRIEAVGILHAEIEGYRSRFRPDEDWMIPYL